MTIMSVRNKNRLRRTFIIGRKSDENFWNGKTHIGNIYGKILMNHLM